MKVLVYDEKELPQCTGEREKSIRCEGNRAREEFGRRKEPSAVPERLRSASVPATENRLLHTCIFVNTHEFFFLVLFNRWNKKQ